MMSEGQSVHNRQSIRLKGYDYSGEGLYFITLCVQGWTHLFGKIVEHKMRLNINGKIVEEELLRSAEIRKEIIIHEYIIMPNHLHAIIEIKKTASSACEGADEKISEGDRPVAMTSALMKMREEKKEEEKEKGDRPVASTGTSAMTGTSAPTGPKKKSLGAFIAGFKAAATLRINVLRKTPGRPVWQRNYYERIIRDERGYITISDYIVNNPRNWRADKFRSQ